MKYRYHIERYKDFPKPGILYRDLGPLYSDAVDFSEAMNESFYLVRDEGIGYRPGQKVVGIESRGFIIASALAVRGRLALVLARKAGKLPGTVKTLDYALEYAKSTIEVQVDSIGIGDLVLIADDVLATGGTALATAKLVESMGATVMGFFFLLEIKDLNGREKLKGYKVASLIQD